MTRRAALIVVVAVCIALCAPGSVKVRAVASGRMNALQNSPYSSDGVAVVILQTTMGDLSISLDTTAGSLGQQVVGLMKQRAYDGAAIGRVAAGYYVQVFGPAMSLPAAPTALDDHPSPNLVGSVSIDRREIGKAPSLTIVLADSPQLDPYYEPIGKVEQGLEVVQQLAAQQVAADGAPVKPAFLEHASLDGAVPRLATEGSSTGAVTILVGLSMLLAGVVVVGGRRMSRRALVGCSLLIVELGFVSLWALLGARAQGSSWLALGLFIGAVAHFWVMGHFETEPR